MPELGVAMQMEIGNRSKRHCTGRFFFIGLVYIEG